MYGGRDFCAVMLALALPCRQRSYTTFLEERYDNITALAHLDLHVVSAQHWAVHAVCQGTIVQRIQQQSAGL